MRIEVRKKDLVCIKDNIYYFNSGDHQCVAIPKECVVGERKPGIYILALSDKKKYSSYDLEPGGATGEDHTTEDLLFLL